MTTTRANLTSNTVEDAATNAVMAGCKPEYFPVVVAAIEGWADKRWGPTAFYVGNASTGGAGQMAIVSEPIRKELGFNSGINVFGPGPAFRANATVGRALQLVMINAWNEGPPSGGTAGSSPSETARKFFYDTLVFDSRAMRYLVDMLGSRQLMIGTDHRR